MAAVGSPAQAAPSLVRVARTVKRWAVANRAALLGFVDEMEQNPVLPPEARDLEQAWHRALRTGLMKAVARGCLSQLVYRQSFTRSLMRRIRADPKGIFDHNPIPRRHPLTPLPRRTRV